MLLGAALAVLACRSAQAEQPTEYEVKAAFIHNIAKFVEWPAAARTTGALRLCVLGQDQSGGALGALRGKPIGNAVWDVAPVDRQSNLSQCRVLFISASESGDLAQVLDGIKDRAVLTMGDTGGYAVQGVMVNFYLEQNRVRFEINPQAASRAGLRISSQLLKLARIVAEPGGTK
jgi:hypothetical protein